MTAGGAGRGGPLPRCDGRRIKLGSGAVILPWNQPLRVVEKVAMLDHLSGGRVLLGMGRGLAKMEYEAADMIVRPS
jgi:alkanesulfonate monooxygenase SsuD/methylene tetrahydromethanopterin reductase-like flavin-dependent oxidoreductase (luciferase family)